MAAPQPTPPPPPPDRHRDDDSDDYDRRSEAQCLPRYIILKSKYNSNYLSQVDETPPPHYRHPCLRYTGPNSDKSLDVQFETEVAQSDTKFVHIRSLRNNCYWEFNLSTKFISATGKKKKENKRSATCTLFQPILVSRADNSYRLRHAFGNYASMWSDSLEDGLDGKNTKEDETGTGVDVHIVVDSESILVLPRYVSFKGSNNKYLRPDVDDNHQISFMVFSGEKITDKNVSNEIFPGPNGVFRIKNIDTGKYWEKSSTSEGGFVLSDDSNTWFTPEKIGDRVIALVYSGDYCRSTTMPEYMDDGTVWFCAWGGGYKDKSIRLEVEEPVVRRVISDISFNNFENHRIYNERQLLVANGEAVNRSTVENEFTMGIKYSDSKIRTYNNKYSLKLTTKATVKASLIPCIVDGKIGFSAEVCGEKEWGNVTGFTKTVSQAIEVVVPKESTRKLSVIATQGWCDIPYTYTQTDTLTNGNIRTLEKLPGVYQGANVYKMDWTISDSLQLPPNLEEEQQAPMEQINLL